MIGIPLFKPSFSKECRDRIARDLDEILAGGRLMLGPFKGKFEEQVCGITATPFCTSVNSCTTALTICLRYFGAGDHEVLVPSGSFITSISSIVFAGGKPVLVDMDPKTLSFDMDDLRRKVTPRTRGMVWVHLTGLISIAFEEILAFARERGLFMIEDAAHAFGASVHGRPAGSLGDAGCFSFYPTKIVTCGTGGMIATRDEGLKRYAEKMRLFGKEAGSDQVSDLGNDWFLDEIRACVGYNQTLDLAQNLLRRREIADLYRNGLKGSVEVLDVPPGILPSYYQFPVFLESSRVRERLTEVLKEKHGIETKWIYRPGHKEEVFRPYDDGTLKKTEETLERSLCLPLYPDMKDEEVSCVMNALLRELEDLA